MSAPDRRADCLIAAQRPARQPRRDFSDLRFNSKHVT
jgi:hypothetical protein